jgi:ADP-heptose:LPS heptosyltransferase
VALAVSDPAGDVLVLRALGLGDLLTGIPVLRGLRRAFSDATITLATRAELASLAVFSGAVDNVLPTSGLGELRWERPPPALAVNLHGRGPESISDLLKTDPDVLITHRNDAYPEVAGPPWREELHEVDRWCALLGSAGIHCEPTDLGLGRPAGQPRFEDTVVIHPGAAAPSRRWPAERFAMVAAALHAAGHRILITGSRTEHALASTVAELAHLEESSVIAGALDVLGMVALISDCRLLLCGVTGVGHIATATGTPSVLLFGPTPPSRWGPRARGPHISIWAGDRGDPHADHPHSGLLLITPDRVLDACRTILSEAA